MCVSVGSIIWIVLFVIAFWDLFVCSIYSRLRRKHDMTRKKVGREKASEIPNKPKSQISILVHKMDNFMYGLCRYTSIVIGHIPSHTIRRWLLKYVFCMQLSKKTIIHGGCEIRSPWNIRIGNSVIGVGAILDGRNGIEIEDDVVLATGVWIWTEQHDAEDPYFRCLDKGGEVVIRRRVWIGNRVSILPKTEIGEGCVLAAGTVVTKDCEPFNMYGGIPAKKLHERNKDLKYTNVTEGVWDIY